MSGDPLEPGGSRGAHWHLDKKVPISFILALLMQTLIGVWYASQLTARVEENHSELIEAKAEIDFYRGEYRNAGERLARIEAILERVDSHLNRIDDRTFRAGEQP